MNSQARSLFQPEQRSEILTEQRWRALLRSAAPTYLNEAIIQPHLAKIALDETNTRNRHMAESTWMRYAIDMLERRWKVGTEIIGWDVDGVLMNGQHRLMACYESKVPLRANLKFGADPSERDVIDGGRIRTTANRGELKGIPNAAAAAAIAALLIAYREHGPTAINDANRRPSHAKVLELMTSDERLATAASRSSALAHRLLHPRIAGFCWYLFSEQDQEKADAFFNDLSKGEGLDSTMPIHRLRERLWENRGSKRKIGSLDVIAIVFKTWNLYRTGRPCRQLGWRSGGDAPEPFPSIEGQQ